MPDEGDDLIDSELNENAIRDDQEQATEGGAQPPSWARSMLVVADPFILAKVCPFSPVLDFVTIQSCTQNATGNISKPSVDRFIAECQRAAFMLHNGFPYAYILGNGTPLTRRPGKRRPNKGKQRQQQKPGESARERSGSALRPGTGSVDGMSPHKGDSRGRVGRSRGQSSGKRNKSKTRSRSKGRSRSKH